jgi:hypothetical protein
LPELQAIDSQHLVETFEDAGCYSRKSHRLNSRVCARKYGFVGRSAVVSSSWLLRTAAFQKVPFKMTFAGSNGLDYFDHRNNLQSSIRYHSLG